MREVNLHYAKIHLSRLVDAAVAGEEILIAREGKPLVRLTPVEPPKQRRTLGQDEGKIWIADNFDDPVPEIEALFYGEGDDEDPA
ncbi:MAG: type II toxin-antitoxin system prevent-host-death family antitoxin [Acidobacteriota bacterium]